MTALTIVKHVDMTNNSETGRLSCLVNRIENRFYFQMPFSMQKILPIRPLQQASQLIVRQKPNLKVRNQTSSSPFS